MTPAELDHLLATASWIELSPELLLHHVDVLGIPHARVRDVIAERHGSGVRAASLTGKERADLLAALRSTADR